MAESVQPQRLQPPREPLHQMNLHHLVVDDFFEEPLELRAWALSRGFNTEISPVDGMEYAGVCKDPPWVFRQEAEIRLSYLMRTPAQIQLSFLRLTTVRHRDPTRKIIHLDHSYAGYLCTVYMNPLSPIGGGTILYRHRETGMASPPTTQEEIDIWIRDCNSPHLWDPIGMAEQAWNRAIVMPTGKFHASMPTTGFGDDPETGRMVFVAFFNI